jgi:hypothetical protein
MLNSNIFIRLFYNYLIIFCHYISSQKNNLLLHVRHQDNKTFLLFIHAFDVAIWLFKVL